MAAKRHLVVLLLLLGAGGAFVLFLLSSESEAPGFSDDDLKFIDVYVKLSVAGEMPAEEPETKALAKKRILEENGVDSLWMTRHAESLSGDTRRQLSIWQEITNRLDSLQKALPGRAKDRLNLPPP